MKKSLREFERTYLERLKLACDVLLELAEDDQVSDGLEVELRGFKEQVEHDLLMPGSTGVGEAPVTWAEEIDLDIEEVRYPLESTRIIRLALDSLEGRLPGNLVSDQLNLEFIELRKKVEKAEREELRKIGHREYLILAPVHHVERSGDKAAAAIRTLDDLGLVIRLDG